MDENIVVGQEAIAGVVCNPALSFAIKVPRTHFRMEAFDPEGKLKWVEEFDNLVTDVGINDLLDKYFKGSTYSATWFVGLKGTGSAAVGDTMASHGGWSEVTGYSEANRQTLTLGTVSAKSVDNSASKATFNINATVTVAGAFTVTNNTKGGSTGTLYGAGDFAASRSLGSGDQLQITITLTGA